jgi:radical SAM protein with 4Fe4S-binding SPASM domain
MTSPFVVLPSSPEPPRNTRLAKGTKTALVEKRQFRLNQPGEQPWTASPDNHRDKVNVEIHGDTYVVFKPSVGALSALDHRNYVAFHVFIGADDGVEALERYFVQIGHSERAAKVHSRQLAARLVSDGWTRSELPNPPQKPLMSAYFTVTRWCDLGCPYCYQGLSDRVNTDMTLDNARLALERIKAVNPECQINVTGGEPFSHKQILDILDLIDSMGFGFVILSNGTYVDEKVANHLKALKGFKYIQISLDGATAETHELTRGKGHFAKAMRGIQSVIDAKLHFKLAPTLHEANLHELITIAELALNNGGWLSPNQLKELPHAGLNYTHVSLSNESLRQALRQVNDHLLARFGLARFIELSRHYAASDPEVCSVTQPNARFICGMAHSLIDIDWNGDVYPCHLSKGPELIIGNVFREEFDAIFRRVEERGIRVKSHEIEKCSGCKFVSNCAGGCRAGAWFTYGTFEHEDELCDINYASNLNRLLVGAGVS